MSTIHIYDELNDATWCGIPDKDMTHKERTIDPAMGDVYPTCDACVEAEARANYPERFWRECALNHGLFTRFED